MSGDLTSKEKPAWLAIGWGEGSAEMRIVHSDREMVRFLWEQCGPDWSGEEEHTCNRWYSYLEDGDNWTHMDGLHRWHCEIRVGETGHISFQLLHGLAHEPPAAPVITERTLQLFAALRAKGDGEIADAFERTLREIERLQDDVIILTSERDKYKQQRADWKAVADSRAPLPPDGEARALLHSLYYLTDPFVRVKVREFLDRQPPTKGEAR